MRNQLDPPLLPRNGRTLKVLGVARISTLNQDPQSLADQEAMHRQWVAEHYDGTAEFKIFATQGSGEWLDRKELLQIQNEVDTRQYDLVLMEDLSRYMRDFAAMDFCGMCVDTGTRLIAINDHIDTAREWEDHAMFASWRHKKYNEDTSRRIKQRLNNRFEKEGAVFQCEIYGYIKPHDCMSDEQVQKDQEATTVYDKWFDLLEQGASFAEVADWLNERQISTGPYCRGKKWTGKMVGRITFNPILKGLRLRNRMHTVKHHGSGHRRSVKAPSDMHKTRSCPHLAHIEPDRYDRVVALVQRRNDIYRRKLHDGQDPLQGRPKKRTRWPGQHCYCGICKRMLVYGAHGQNDHLVCRGTAEHKCWNAVSFDARLGAKKLVARIREEIEGLPNFDAIFVENVHKKMQAARDSSAARMAEFDRRGTKLERDRRNLMGMIREFGGSVSIAAELKRLEDEEADLKIQRQALARAAKEKVELPSMEKIKASMAESFDNLALTSQEFARLMRKLIPRIVVYPCRLIDGGDPVLRARFTLNLVNLIPGGGDVEDLGEVLTRELTVDLFEPPQREAYRQKFLNVLAVSPRKKLYEIAEQDLKITPTAVQKTAMLVRLMRQRGVDDPYEPLTQPPEEGRLRRHKHRRFSFEPLAEFEDVSVPATDSEDDVGREAA